MAVFDSYLYVGTYKYAVLGCEVWRSSDGIIWNQVNTVGFGDTNNTGAYSMVVFGNHLHVGTRNDANACEVWRSNDGTSWDSLNTDGFSDANNWRAPSLAIFDSNLYVGTYNENDGCEVWRLPQDSDDDGIKDDEDKCPCHPNGINKGTCVMDVGNVIMSYEEGDELIPCDDDIDCVPTGGYCQKVQGDCNWNGIGDVCEGYADFNESGDVNLVDLLDLIICYGKTNFETHPQCEPYDINDDNRVSAWDYLILTLQYGLDGFDTCGTGIAPARVARTGQSTCYEYIDPDWVIGDCLDTGQDGEYQKGVIGPSPRFTIHGDGTVTDNLTGLMWTQDAQLISGTMIWSTALNECNNLDHATHTDWRLPNERELLSLIDFGEYSPVLPLGHPFSNVQSDYYWSSTTYAGDSGNAFFVHMGYGYNYYRNKLPQPSYVWCMRGESNGPSPVPKTGQTVSYATGDDGGLQMGVAWPNPRFTDNGDGTVTDNLTRLIWLKNTNCFGSRTWAEALSDVNGLASGSCGLTDGSSASDWRLPNGRELHSLIHYGYFNPALPNTTGTGCWSPGDPFSNVQSSNYWSSTASAPNTGSAWSVRMLYGYVSLNNKTSYYSVWPVRGGQ